MATTAELIVQGLVTLTGGGAAAAGLNAYFSRRTTRAAVTKTQAETGKTGAEITNVGAGTANLQVDTSLGLLREMRIDLERIREEAATAREEAAAARAEIEKLRDWRRRQELLNAAHGAWDALVSERLAAAGIDLPSPPPLIAADY
jgi:hypothetical protein